MFQEPDDMGACPAPLLLEDMRFGEAEGSDGGSIVPQLYDNLKGLISSKAGVGGLLGRYLQGRGVGSLFDESDETFYASHPAVTEKRYSRLQDLYAVAVDLFFQADYPQAAGVFCLIASQKGKAAGSLIALSACAVREAEYNFGYELALASIKDDGMHPRARLLAGYCAFQLKDKKSAKHHLSLANRLARRDSTYRKEQRAAQRHLLLLQFD